MKLPQAIHLFEERRPDFKIILKFVPGCAAPAALLAYQPELLPRRLDEDAACFGVAYQGAELVCFHRKVCSGSGTLVNVGKGVFKEGCWGCTLDEAPADGVVALDVAADEISHFEDFVGAARHSTASRLEVSCY